MEAQSGAYYACNILRVMVRDPGRVGEIVDSAAWAGAIVASSFSFKASEEALARRAAIEAAGKDARAKAEALAAATGRRVGDPIAVTEEMIASNGTYAALSTFPFAFGVGAPQVAGELEFYARVSARFRFH
jgi:uncharacterized protein YggE